MTDLTYTQDGMFTRFVPQTTDGENVWRSMVEQHGAAAVLNIHRDATLARMRKAGYSVAKARPVKAGEINAILTELGV